MGGPRHGVLIDAQPRGKEAQLVVTGLPPQVGGRIRRRLHHHQSMAVCAPQGSAVHGEISQGETAVHQGHAVPQRAAPVGQWRLPKQLHKLAGHRGLLHQLAAGERQAHLRGVVRGYGHRQGAAAGGQLQPRPGAQQAPVVQPEGGRQGGVAAEGHLTAGGEPTQAPGATAITPEKGRFRLAQAARHSLHPGGLGRGLQQHHTGPIALQGFAGEGLDQQCRNGGHR